MKLNPKGVFFDLVDTLVVHDRPWETWFIFTEALQECLMPHGLTLTSTELSNKCMLFFQNTPSPIGCEGDTIFEKRIKSFCNNAGLTVTNTDVKKTATYIIGVWRKHISLAPDCHQVLEILFKKKKLALVTNYDHPPAIRQLITDMKIEKYFSAIIISGEVGYQKPDPAIFNLALQKTGLLAEQVLHVGDSEDDINGAISAGIVPIRIMRTRNGLQEKPTVGVKVITKLQELIELVD
jgi:HAD superfamily hydrolase (TIGR01549 family)